MDESHGEHFLTMELVQGRTLGVQAVLEGSVRKAGERLPVTVQLINVPDGYHL